LQARRGTSGRACNSRYRDRFTVTDLGRCSHELQAGLATPTSLDEAVRIGDYVLVRVGDQYMWLYDADVAIARLRAELARARAEIGRLRAQRDSASAFLDSMRKRVEELERPPDPGLP
jgi:hypothetical protein